MRKRTAILLLAIGAPWAGTPVAAQVDPGRANLYFAEVARLCQRERGRLWGVSLCGPIVVADPVTGTIATNQAPPAASRPAVLGYANAAIDWGGTRWTTVSWPLLPQDARIRNRLFIHEMFHRIQPELGLLGSEGNSEHLDTPEGRYWLQLEWRALAAALGAKGAARDAAVRDALAFRQARHERFADAAENERRLEINEGLAQYTGTVVATETASAALADAIEQLRTAPIINETLVRTFPYPAGAAYGLLLDVWSAGWTRRIKVTDDLAALLMSASQLAPSPEVEAAAVRYDGGTLRAAEAQREADRQQRVAQLRRRFVDGPVLTLPNGRNSSFVTNGITPIPGAGTVYPTFRTSGPWGSLEAEAVLLSPDRSKLSLPAPAQTGGDTITGEGWTLRIARGWIVRPAARAGDFELVPVSR